MSELDFEAFLQIQLQLFVLLNDGLPDGKFLFIPQYVINVFSIFTSCFSLWYTNSNHLLYLLHGHEQTIQQNAIFFVLFKFPTSLTKINWTLVVPLTFMVNYVTVIQSCYNTDTDSTNIHDYIDFNYIDIFFVIILYILDELIYNHLMQPSHYNTIKIAKYNNEMPNFTDFYSVFIYFNKRLCTKNLTILVSHFFSRNALFNIVYVIVCFYQWYTYEFDVSACKNQFSPESCHLVADRLHRVNCFFLYVMIYGIVYILYILIVLLLLHFQKVGNLLIAKIFGLVEICENEQQSNQSNINTPQELEMNEI